jgi:uncharacterized membrane protein
MMLISTTSLLAFANPIKLEYFSGWIALGIFVACAIPIVLLGMRSLSGLGPVRKWVAIGARLLVLFLFVLILGGIRWQRQNKIVEVMAIRDVSQSTMEVRDYPGKSLQQSIDDTLQTATKASDKQPDDRIGQVSFSNTPQIDDVPNITLRQDTHAIRAAGNGTDAAAAIQLALATMSKDAMHRLVLFWDGNATAGNIDEAVSAAASQHVPIDVFPLKYDIQHEVMVDHFIAPTWKRENEPFSLDVYLKSTNALPVQGKLSVLHNDAPMDLDANTPGVQATRIVTLQPGTNHERVYVPALQAFGIHQFKAIFEGENVSAEVGQAPKPGEIPKQGDTLLDNNTASAFTYVKGKGKILYIDNSPEQRGVMLRQALQRADIELDNERTGVDQFPGSLMELQNYDAVILGNVPRGAGGLSDDQQKMLAAYVHDLGGGLLMIGGEDTFGAGGWQGSKLEEVLPVNMEIPAQRVIPKGALVLVMHSCEMPDGNFWGMQCALKAVETLSARDEVGVITFGWNGGMSNWDYPLSEKGDGSRVNAAIKNMQVGDMPSFDDSLNVAMNGVNGQGGLVRSDARQKHVIVVSDGDPAMPQDKLIQQFRQQKVTISTVTIYTHTPGTPSPQMQAMAKQTGGRVYGPIESNPGQLPQIFIKEARVVRRSMIYEETKPPYIPLRRTPTSSDMMKGLPGDLPAVTGLVLTSRKPNPQVEVPILAGKNNDPLFAHWQTGLGRAAVWTSDAYNRWGFQWTGSPLYDKFWTQVVRGVARPPMSTDFEVQTTQVGDKGRITVEATNKEDSFLNFLSINGAVVGPDNKPLPVRLVQTGPGTYEGEFDAKEPGTYAASLSYKSPKGNSGLIVSGMAVNSSPELRDLKSNEALLKQIAERTGGRYYDQPWQQATAGLFTREGLQPSASPLPIWDLMIPILLALILIDIAIRRIAWDWQSTKRLVAAAGEQIRMYTTQRKVESGQTLDALKKVRTEVSETKFKVGEEAAQAPSQRPNPKAKFEATEGVEGDISKVVGGASDKPIPSAPKGKEPKGGVPEQGHTSSLLEAKRRAQQKMKEREQGDQ